MTSVKTDITYEEALAKSIEYFNGDTLAAEVFLTKYAMTDTAGNLKESTPRDMHERLAREFARIEAKYPNPMSYDEIFGLLDKFEKIVPQGSPMAGIGNPYQIQSISNCFVIDPPVDSYGGIFKADQELVQIAKRRGGVGLDISNIRPKGLPTSNAARTTDGITVFMERFSNSCREVAQGGRRGALMETISVHHMQIRDFIRIKQNRDKVTGANISIRLSDEFLQAVEKGEKFQLRHPVNEKANPLVSEWIDAGQLWSEIIESAWKCAEPGLLFWDTLIRESPGDCYADLGYNTVGTNPCGELPIPAYDSCRLLLLNLIGFVKNPYTPHAYFDYDEFVSYAVKAQRLMDDLVDIEIEQIDKILEKIAADPESDDVKQTERSLWEKIRVTAANGRRTGLGVTAVGDALASLGYRYGTDEAITVVEKIYQHLALAAYNSSCTMAEERGAFPIFNFAKEKTNPYLNRLYNVDNGLIEKMQKHGRRNIALLTTSPGGSLSTLTQTTSGIEPAYKLWYTRRKKITGQDVDQTPDFIDQSGDKWREYDVFHHGFKKWMEITGKTKEDVEASPYWQSTSADINWVQGVKLQAAAQKWVDHAISRTQNLPEDVSVEEVKKIYTAAWKAGCKGYTIYRENSRTGVLVDKSAAKKSASEAFVESDAPKRPKDLPCDIHRVNVKGDYWTILVGLMNDKPYEIMGGSSNNIDIPKRFEKGVITKRDKKNGKATYDLHCSDDIAEVTVKDIVTSFDNPDYAGLTRLVSLSLRHGAKVNYITEQILKGDKDAHLFSFGKVISRVLKHYIKDGTRPSRSSDCTECGAKDSVRYLEGCAMCTQCLAGKCS